MYFRGILYDQPKQILIVKQKENYRGFFKTILRNLISVYFQMYCEGLRFDGSHLLTNIIIQTKEHSRHVRDNNVERFKSWLGYKTRQGLQNLRFFCSFHHLKMVRKPTAIQLSICSDWKGRALFREAAKRPIVVLEELIFHKSGPSGREALMEGVKKSLQETKQMCGRRCSSQIRPKLLCLHAKQDAWQKSDTIYGPQNTICETRQ